MNSGPTSRRGRKEVKDLGGRWSGQRHYDGFEVVLATHDPEGGQAAKSSPDGRSICGM
jgi:hypothetical protein